MACNKYSIFDLQKGKELNRKTIHKYRSLLFLVQKENCSVRVTGRYTHTHTHTSLTLNSNEWHKKYSYKMQQFFPHNSWGKLTNLWTKHVCYWHESYKERAGPDFTMKGTVFITQTHTNCRFVGQERCEDGCWTSWWLVNYITEMCLDNTSKTMTGDKNFARSLTVQLPWLI